MALAALYNIPGTPSELNDWAFAHAANHRDINRIVFQALHIQLPAYILDPLDPKNIQIWLYQHQQLHQEMDTVLGISGYDLLDVDWQDVNERAGWILLNSDEHKQACNILGLG